MNLQLCQTLILVCHAPRFEFWLLQNMPPSETRKHARRMDKMILSAIGGIAKQNFGEMNEDDLIIALSTNVIMGAGIDVYDKEPLPENNKLRFLPNALLTPHIGYVTAENYSIYYTQMLENLEACIAGKPIREIK